MNISFNEHDIFYKMLLEKYNDKYKDLTFDNPMQFDEFIRSLDKGFAFYGELSDRDLIDMIKKSLKSTDRIYRTKQGKIVFHKKCSFNDLTIDQKIQKIVNEEMYTSEYNKLKEKAKEKFDELKKLIYKETINGKYWL